MGTGDLTYLQEQRDYLKNMLARYATYVDDSGSEILPECRFADWPTNENPEEQHRGLQGLLRYAMNEGTELMRYLDEPEMEIRVKSFPVKPMTPEEAILQMNLLGHMFFVFRDADTSAVCVVYKRKDGAYGLIVPQ